IVLRSLAFVVCAAAASGAETTMLKPVQTVSLAGVKGRIDHLAVDVKGQRLFVVALGNNTVEYSVSEGGDAARKLLASSPQPSPPEEEREKFPLRLTGYTVEVIDLAVGKRAHSISGLPKPQGVLFLPELDRYYVAVPERGNQQAQISIFQPKQV